MTSVDLRFHGYKYLPYERRLAELEAKRLLRCDIVEAGDALHARAREIPEARVLEKFTYFRNIGLPDGSTVVPEQARLEASATVHGDPLCLHRQSTRYSAHGLHEYRGKFNPQVVRAAMNLVGLEAGEWVWDPFCGSGTVLLEALHQGVNAIGVDLNPLAVTITNAKLLAMRARPGTLERATDDLAEEVEARSTAVVGEPVDMARAEELFGTAWLERFASPEYLLRWFPVAVLAQFWLILEAIRVVTPAHLRWVYRTILSDTARGASWQEPADLRIRRRKTPAENYPVTQVFLERLRTRVATIAAARRHLRRRTSWQKAFGGDSCEPGSLGGRLREHLDKGMDCVLSSPPYATALPYVDTQRLNIALFGLATAGEIRRLDARLVGSREVSTGARRMLEAAIDENGARVAPEVWRLCRRLKEAYTPEMDGFRRRNTAAVVYRYFAGMTQAMRATAGCLRNGGWLAFVVGANRARLGGEEYAIDTPALLASTGEYVGLRLVEVHALDTYSRYSIHQRNSIREERLVVMQRGKR